MINKLPACARLHENAPAISTNYCTNLFFFAVARGLGVVHDYQVNESPHFIHGVGCSIDLVRATRPKMTP